MRSIGSSFKGRTPAEGRGQGKGMVIRALVGVASLVVGVLTTLAVAAAPAGAAPTVGPPQVVSGTTFLDGVSCSSATACVAVGDGGVVVPIAGGTPGAAQVVSGIVFIFGVACSSATTCVAVGTNETEGVMVPITGGTPGAAQAVSGTGALYGVSCSSATNCVAVGTDGPGTGGVVVPIVGGTTGAVRNVAGTHDLAGVACTVAACEAVGYSSSGGVVVNISGTDGTPGAAQAVSGTADLAGVACATVTACMAVGESPSGTGTVVPITAGTPGPVRLASGTVSLRGIVCPAAIVCEAVGRSSGFPGVVVAITSAAGVAAVVPAAGTEFLTGIACSDAAHCEAVGYGSTSQGGKKAYQGVEVPVATGVTTTAPVFTADSPPSTATVGARYSYTFAASGHPAPTFSVSSGSLPPGLSLDSHTGILSGTPTTPGSSTFTVSASNGTNPDALSPAITIMRAHNLVFTGVAPTRVCDTRPPSMSGITDACSGHRLTGGVPLVVNLPASVVPRGAGAVVANVTVTGPGSVGYLSVYATGATPPASTNVNFTTGQTVANLVTVATGFSVGLASISVVDGPGTAGADVIVDVEGYDAPPGVSTAGGFHPLTPARAADTRCGQTIAPSFCATEGLPAVNRSLRRIGPGAQDPVAVTGVGGVPSAGVAAVAVNVTVVSPSSAGYVTVAPGGSIPIGGPPASSSINFAPGEVLANEVLVPVAPDGTITVFNHTGSTDAVVDVVGWFSNSDGPPGATFTPVPPVRLADTRCVAVPTPSYCPGEHLPATYSPPRGGDSINVAVGGTGVGTPSRVPIGIDAAVLDVIDVTPGASNYLTVYPVAAPVPPTSDVNWAPTNTYNVVPGAAYAATGFFAGVAIFNGPTQPARTDIIVDLFGYYTPPGG